MKRFFIKLMIFPIPLVIAGLALLALAAHVGLFLSFQDIAERQVGETTVLYDAPLIQSGVYKEYVISARQPDVVIIGSSRILTFRNNFCNLQPEKFYNAGLRTLDIESMNYYAQDYIAAASPEVLILGLDQPSFNADYRRVWPDIVDYDISPIQQSWTNIRTLVRIAVGMDSEEWSRLIKLEDPIYGDTTIGTQASLNGMGYRNDGSYQFGFTEANADRRGIARLFITPEQVFLTGSEVNEITISQLDELLQYAVANDVYVIGFFPPFSPNAYDKNFADHPEDYTYLVKAKTRLEALFDGYDFAFYDFTIPIPLGITNQMMLDQWHMSERSALIVYQALLEHEPEALGSCSDADYLQSLLDNSEHPFLLIETK